MELYNEEAELNAVFCDLCGTHHSLSISCENNKEEE